jgi:hypothetical protein
VAPAGNGSTAIHWAEDVSVGNGGRAGPGIDGHLHPRWHRRGADPPVFSDEIDKTPAPVALLDVREWERCHFRSPQPAAEKNCQLDRFSKITDDGPRPSDQARIGMI